MCALEEREKDFAEQLSHTYRLVRPFATIWKLFYKEPKGKQKEIKRERDLKIITDHSELNKCELTA